MKPPSSSEKILSSRRPSNTDLKDYQILRISLNSREETEKSSSPSKF